jgi:drug/metabolite transporter (DMT)-like permease
MYIIKLDFSYMEAKNNLFAILFMILNCFIASVMTASVKSFGAIPIFMLLSSYNLIVFIMIGIYALKNKISLLSSKVYLLILRSFLGVMGYYFYFKSTSLTSLSNIAIISYLDPILTTIFAYLIVKEKITISQSIEILIGFICAIIIINPLSINFDYGSSLVCLATIFWAFSNVVMKKLGKTENVIVQIFYVSLFTIFISLILSFYSSEDININKNFINCAVIMGILALIQYASVYKALTLAPAGVVMPFFFTQLIFSNAISVVFFDDIIGMAQVCGTIVLVSMNALQIFYYRKKLKNIA